VLPAASVVLITRVTLPLGVVTVWIVREPSVVVDVVPSALVVVVVVVSRVRSTVAPFPFAVGSASVSVVVVVTGGGGGAGAGAGGGAGGGVPLSCAAAAIGTAPAIAISTIGHFPAFIGYLLLQPTFGQPEWLSRRPRSVIERGEFPIFGKS
jgi:hypothetical protein